MKIQEIVETNIETVQAYKLPDGSLYATKEQAVAAYVESKAPPDLCSCIFLVVAGFLILTFPLWLPHL
jgi:hypothetical protein